MPPPPVFLVDFESVREGEAFKVLCYSDGVMDALELLKGMRLLQHTRSFSRLNLPLLPLVVLLLLSLLLLFSFSNIISTTRCVLGLITDITTLQNIADNSYALLDVFFVLVVLVVRTTQQRNINNRIKGFNVRNCDNPPCLGFHPLYDPLGLAAASIGAGPTRIRGFCQRVVRRIGACVCVLSPHL